MRAPQIAGWDSTDHQTASDKDMSASQDSKMPPSASDHEKRGGLGLSPPTG